ncbi:hypothetical protein [uncultured Parasphingorhabdus sp.]|uniref:hypothetical protein n=1 Tax=uncultured Parasphingorhabdus sp. TaxID=2709694 RepID=UPI0030D981BE|tara:strand:- start:9901 stop:11466 length:1566 start_codon:yes stop_codon:yes gene_type:complete
MRLIGVGLLAFLLAGVLVLLGQGGAFKTGWSKLSGSDQLQFSDYEGAAERGSVTSGTDVFTTGQNTDIPLILSGLPSYTGQIFRLPINARPVKGRYQLVFSSRVSDGVEGVLRVSINGIKRADILLNQSKVQQKVEIELTATELSSEALDVGLSLQGRGPIAQCSVDDSIAAVVEIKPESGMRLELSKPVDTTRDLLALWGDRVPVLWNAKNDNADELVTIVHAARLVEKGYSLQFGTNGLDSTALNKLSGEAKSRGKSFVGAAYPIAIADTSINRGTRKFDRRTSWRYHYNAKDLPEQILPSALDMRLAVGPTGNDASYDLTVMLNDHMLFSRRLPAQTERISQSLLLPAKHQQSENKLEISLAKADLNLNRCGTETQSMAELLPETMLRGGGEKASGNLSILQAQLRAANMVALVGDINTAVDAQAVAQLLGQLEPRGLSFVKGTSGANIRIVIGDLAAGIAKKGAQPTDWVIYRSMDRNVGIVVRPASQIEALTAPAIALLISIPSNGKDNRQSGNAG